MGSYLNPGTKGFEESLNSEIYVDKTMLLEQTNARINTKQKFLCVSRPRRFGKSMAMDMLNIRPWENWKLRTMACTIARCAICLRFTACTIG